MNKPWLGFVAAALFLVAGVFELVAHKYVIGVVFIVLAIANVIIFTKLRKPKD